MCNQFNHTPYQYDRYMQMTDPLQNSKSTMWNILLHTVKWQKKRVFYQNAVFFMTFLGDYFGVLEIFQRDMASV